MGTSAALQLDFGITAALHNRQWFSNPRPFHHFHVRNVFETDVYSALEQHYLAVLARGLSETPTRDRFARMAGYDAYSFSFTREMEGPLTLFTSRRWHDLIASAYQLRATGDVRGGLHHHLPGSGTGGVHNDLNPGWFAGQPQPGKVNLSDAALCSYHTGKAADPLVLPRRTIRAVAVLFYLCNPLWQPGDGGETALFRSYSRSPDKPELTVPPIDNSMLVFECTPESWHTFVSNRLRPRNSVIMWLHRDYTEAVKHWGEEQIIKW
jgi:hypothetical protein